MVSITSGVSLRYRPCYKNVLNMTMTTNAENLRQNKSRLSLIAEQRLAFTSSTHLIREVKNLSPNFKRISNNVLRYKQFSFRQADPFYRKTFICTTKSHVQITCSS